MSIACARRSSAIPARRRFSSPSRAAIGWCHRFSLSALDVLIRRLMSQRASLERGTSLVNQLPGPALQIGWGDGAAYDHLREILRRRDLFVFDRAIAAPLDAPPAAEHRILGDPAETLPQAWERWR